MRLRFGGDRAENRDRPIPAYQAIGRVRRAPKRPPPRGWDGVESEIAIEPRFAPALEGLDGYSHVWVIFALDGVGPDGRSALRQRPPGAPGEVGVFALRTPARPNPIGIAAVRIVRIAKGTVRVKGLDAFGGTPVLDLKPYIPYYDSVPEAGVPDWIGQP